MILLYHKFIKNARSVFLRGMIFGIGVSRVDDKIFYFCNFSSKKSLFSAFKVFTIVVPVGVFTRCFSLLSFYRALEFSLSFPIWFLVVFLSA